MSILHKILRTYQKWYLNYTGIETENSSDSLSFFRDKLFLSILALSVVLGTLAYVPSTVFAILNDDFYIFIIDTLSLITIYTLAFNNGINLKIKKILFALIFYFLGFTVLIFIGLSGNGAIIVLVPNILITLYSGRKAGLYSLLLTAIIYTGLLVVAYFEIFDLPIFKHDDFNLMFIVFVNNIIFIFFIVLSIAYLIDLLHSSLVRQNRLKEALKEENENVLVAKEKAEQSDRLKTAFLANMSHEIKTPMYGLLSSINEIKLYNKDNREFQEYVNVIETTGNRLSDVISDVISVSKIKTGLMTLNLETFNIRESIDQVIKRFDLVAKKKNIKVINQIRVSRVEGLVYSDKEKFEVIFKHILENAFKYTNRDGYVEIGCSQPDKSYFEFYVKDSGIGISMTDLQSIFQPFYRADIDNTKALHGSGLGLSLAKSYIEMLGGEIHIESKENKGTKVWFTIYSDLGNVTE